MIRVLKVLGIAAEVVAIAACGGNKLKGTIKRAGSRYRALKDKTLICFSSDGF